MQPRNTQYVTFRSKEAVLLQILMKTFTAFVECSYYMSAQLAVRVTPPIVLKYC